MNAPLAPTPRRVARRAAWQEWKARHRRGSAVALVEYDQRAVGLLVGLGLVPQDGVRKDEIGVAIATTLAVLADWVETTHEGTAWAWRVRASLPRK